jgi:hypothetical protein
MRYDIRIRKQEDIDIIPWPNNHLKDALIYAYYLIYSIYDECELFCSSKDEGYFLISTLMKKRDSGMDEDDVKLLREELRDVLREIDPSLTRRGFVRARSNFFMSPPPDMKVITEDVGKILEKAVCMALHISFVGNFRYSMEESKIIAARIVDYMSEHYKGLYIHTARGGAPYDISPECSHSPRVYRENTNKYDYGLYPYISCKSNKSAGYKVAPHSIGQPTPETFCKRVELPYKDVGTLKRDIQDTSTLIRILKILVDHTFDAHIIYYHKPNNTIQLIVQENPITWEGLNYSWTRSADDWNNSTSLKVNGKTILEIQFHATGRKNMAIRWEFSNLLHQFKDNFIIHNI